MGLYSVRGTIAQFGQCQFDNKFAVYAFIEIVDPDGSRRLVKNVGVGVDVQSVIDVGSVGEFYFDEIFSTGGSSQLLGVSVDGRNVIDSVDVRKALAWHNLAWGTVMTPIFGIGLPFVCLGVVRSWPLMTGSGHRRKFFCKREAALPAVEPKSLPLPEKIGLGLLSCIFGLLTKTGLELPPAVGQFLRGVAHGTARKS